MWITEISTYVFDSLWETLFENCGKPKGFQSGVRIGPQNPVQNRKNGAFFKRLKRTTPRRIQSECSNTKSLHYLKVCQQNEIFSPRPRRHQFKARLYWQHCQCTIAQNCSSVSRRGTNQGKVLKTARLSGRGRFIRGIRRSGFIEDEHRLMARPVGHLSRRLVKNSPSGHFL